MGDRFMTVSYNCFMRKVQSYAKTEKARPLEKERFLCAKAGEKHFFFYH